MTAPRPKRAAATPRRTAVAPSDDPTPAPDDAFPLAGFGRRHPAIGLGLWALGHWNAEDEARTKAAIARAYELGLRWFDTAEVYGAGRSERLLGDVLHHSRTAGADAFVVTKVSWEHLRPTQVRAALVNSLERLGRRAVDLYLVHAPDPRVPIESTLEILEALRKEQKIGAIGVSNFDVEQLEEASRHLSDSRIVVNQIRYSLLDREDAEPIVEYCRSHDILVEAYTPLARGVLAGKYLDGGKVPPEVRRFAQDLFGESTLPVLLGRARRLRDLAAEHDVPLASLALRWLHARGVAPVFGASRPEQVDQILRAWAVRPAETLLAEADAIGRGDRA